MDCVYKRGGSIVISRRQSQVLLSMASMVECMSRPQLFEIALELCSVQEDCVDLRLARGRCDISINKNGFVVGTETSPVKSDRS